MLNDKQLSDAIRGSDYVIHVASPFSRETDESAFIPAAVEGTMSVMRACKKHGVRRCVLTSSVAAAIFPNQRPEALFNESFWSDANNSSISAYAKSKTLAEKAAWDY